MSIRLFNDGDPGTTISSEKAPPFDVSSLTIDQHGMLELLGNPQIVDYDYVEYELSPPCIEGVARLVMTRTLECACPVVRILGRDRLVMPNGDVRDLAEFYAFN